jgi:hypothetical protein
MNFSDFTYLEIWDGNEDNLSEFPNLERYLNVIKPELLNQESLHPTLISSGVHKEGLYVWHGVATHF